jgi:hypothetical protein
VTITSKVRWGPSSFSLTFWSALAHPDESLRRQVYADLTDWIERGDPAWSEEQIRDVVRGLKGSEVAPFQLSDTGLEAAVLVARMLFSQRFMCTRFRIASEDSLADNYGVVLTNRLGHFVQGRRLGALPGRGAAGMAVLVPGALAHVGESLAVARQTRMLPASVILTDRGPIVRVTTTLWDGAPKTRATEASGVHGAKNLAELGLTVSVERAAISVSARSPEAIIRLSALQAGRRLLMLNSGEEGSDRTEAPTIVVRLEPFTPGSESVPLKALTAWRLPQLKSWLRFYRVPAKDLPSEMRRLILTQVAMHRGLLDADLMETLA